MEELLSAKQIAERWHVHPSTVYRLVKSGRLEGLKLGGSLRVTASSVVTYEREARVHAA